METGRWNGNQKEERFCGHSCELEDEPHGLTKVGKSIESGTYHKQFETTTNVQASLK